MANDVKHLITAAPPGHPDGGKAAAILSLLLRASSLVASYWALLGMETGA